MFGLFKGKQSTFGSADERSRDILARAAAMLEMQLMLCKAETKKYKEFINSKFARGYLIGFFDAALQHAKIRVTDEKHFCLLISVGHTYLMQGDIDKAGDYTLESLSLQGDDVFDEAQAQGGAEYFDFLNGKIRNPMGLITSFHGTTDERLVEVTHQSELERASPQEVERARFGDNAKIKLKLSNGRVVSVSEYRHNETYGSLLEGRPSEAINNSIIEEKILGAKRGLDEPFLIKPEIYADKNGDNNLPPVCCFAELYSEPMNRDMHGSFLIVVWFTKPFFDEPLALFLERSLKDIPWEEFSRDFEW